MNIATDIPADKEKAPQWEDALAYLPRHGMVEYQRQAIIYDVQQPSGNLSLIFEGRVKVSTVSEDGSETALGIFGVGQFFGEPVLLVDHPRRERAVALEKTKLMSWSAVEIETRIEQQPKLGLALMQILAGRCLDLKERLQSLAHDKSSKRVAWALNQFARSGARQPDGSVSIPPLTHQSLSEYVGTSREIVTGIMTEFRRLGFVRYSRKAIQVYPEALTEHLRIQRG